jgi:hypothetical protein
VGLTEMMISSDDSILTPELFFKRCWLVVTGRIGAEVDRRTISTPGFATGWSNDG